MPHPILIPELSGLTGIAHGFFGRRGGVSEGIYASLNCGVGSKDSPKAVRRTAPGSPGIWAPAGSSRPIRCTAPRP